ncbi:MAG TPA: 23S rRNA (adenine(2503)-C(2))-methyltransferase RlmN [Candidatus Syntrophosphaera sp.]|jgi:23S rRNA (adenine2503-C2)-methyltransferase|nr:23S rRNA (adenine(2503)-C(2))-methyltransferase RlmN [Candidatus Syntrophosphaera sp.]HOU71908.1 23S rRNA (adenine(2503)-C(2))-methyltransferase RlmN [Candidatus Syntrophosphaera sp.]HPB43485.1 23S rRNA (adenine(2503)-C(2))-methyltransferase RlmN [Candidatus Syntrophosphaera sp.]HPK82963.1 23S rRNA (adenine(2503)-C(2))-methyltransferase RlmN [Candidatus Syntrophosphaera sp.]HQG94904.1 23S rRNA (adenine(2503)-C(2))-methyltransferase RlmN [Candidatus Syntrophosphaera sp.]
MLSSLYGIRPEELQSFFSSAFPAYRVRQLLNWIYRKFVFDPALMTDLASDFRAALVSAFDLSMPAVAEKKLSVDGSAKYRLVLADGAQIEMVLMPQDKKQTLCVSTQVGCSRACAFCATGRMGRKRDLAVHEIVQQVLLAASEAEPALTNLVFMGMGEPLDNLDNVLEAVSLIQHERALAFSPRRVTVSTCGIVPGIQRLAESGLKVKLAVSLNSTRDEVRGQLMPVNNRYPLSVLKRALLYYQHCSPFRITLEYILIPDVNMAAQDLKALRKFCGDLSCKLNFIPYNPVPSLPFRAPTEAEIEAFMESARDLPQAVTLRRSKGADISGACGQLVAESTAKPTGVSP